VRDSFTRSERGFRSIGQAWLDEGLRKTGSL
jgi:hypothetical protein